MYSIIIMYVPIYYWMNSSMIIFLFFTFVGKMWVKDKIHFSVLVYKKEGGGNNGSRLLRLSERMSN